MPVQIDVLVPQFSIVIPVYNDWGSLEDCLRSLDQQAGHLGFEVVIIDDGSQVLAPESVRQFGTRFPLTITRQPHAGIAAARNLGIRKSKGTTLVFTDADCRLDSSCLSALNSRISSFPQHKYFQLRLAGNSSNLVGRAEELRFLAIQSQLLQPDGRIRYLNTSGFAIRRSAIDTESFLFDPAAQRSEDTLLLTNLIQNGELPFFVTDALVRHVVRMSFMKCISRDVRVAWLESRTFERIAVQGVEVRMKNRERIAMLRSTWKSSREPSIGRGAWFILVFRQALQRAISLLYRLLPFRSKVRPAGNSQ